MEDLKPFADTVGIPFEGEVWKMDHAYWSPDNSKILFQIKCLKNSLVHSDFTFYCNADGSNLKFLGKKTMHGQWWNNELIFGHDWIQKDDKFFRVFDLKLNPVETAAGYGCHGSPSPDKNWVVSESWYGDDPVQLFLYKRGKTEPYKLIYSQPNDVGTDTKFWDRRSHVHPAWSNDGKRIYFNAWPAGSKGSRVFCYKMEK